MKRNYHVIEGKGKSAERGLAAFYMANGQMLLPLVELIWPDRGFLYQVN